MIANEMVRAVADVEETEKSMARRRVTLDEVASASNASSATVSLALRNKPGVSRETRERILATAHALGYQRTIRAGRENGAALRNVPWSSAPGAKDRNGVHQPSTRSTHGC